MKLQKLTGTTCTKRFPTITNSECIVNQSFGGITKIKIQKQENALELTGCHIDLTVKNHKHLYNEVRFRS